MKIGEGFSKIQNIFGYLIEAFKAINAVVKSIYVFKVGNLIRANLWGFV